MAVDDQHPSRITVSRDALRADLAEMELRLRVYFDERLKQKADESIVREHALLLDHWARGEFTPAQRRAVEEVVEDHLTDVTDRGWTKRERVMGLVVFAIVIASFAISLWAGQSAGSANENPRTALFEDRGDG